MILVQMCIFYKRILRKSHFTYSTTDIFMLIMLGLISKKIQKYGTTGNC